MANSKLLREAIADARAVRETALQNAKQALEEAFTPKIESMLSTKIQNEVETGDDYNFDEPTEESPDYNFPEVTNEDNVAGDVDSEKHPNQVDGEGQDIDDLVEALDDEDDVEDEVEDVEDELEDVEDEAEEDLEENVDADYDVDDEEEEVEDDEEDLDLESVIRELEEELNETDGYDGEEDGNFTDTDYSTDHDVASEIDEVYEIDLQSLIREMGGDEEEFDFEDEEDEEEDELEVENLRRENSRLREDLNEHREAIRSLRDTLSEVNLLNSKLLYTNKLFSRGKLNNSQKLKVIEQFDRAANVREVKLLYATLAEAFKGNTSNDSTKKNITEGLASKPVGSTKPSNTGKNGEILNEGSSIAKRFQQLAGIRNAYEDK